MLNKLGHYIFKRICKDQELLRKSQPMNIYGLYVRPSDIQRYISDYTNYGIDYTGEDNVAAEDICHYSGLRSTSSYAREDLKHYLDDFFEPMIEKYWDDKDEDL